MGEGGKSDAGEGRQSTAAFRDFFQYWHFFRKKQVLPKRFFHSAAGVSLPGAGVPRTSAPSLLREEGESAKGDDTMAPRRPLLAGLPGKTPPRPLPELPSSPGFARRASPFSSFTGKTGWQAAAPPAKDLLRQSGCAPVQEGITLSIVFPHVLAGWGTEKPLPRRAEERFFLWRGHGRTITMRDEKDG